jgi:F0F1-type ATP synthase membrane subunit b/b'
MIEDLFPKLAEYGLLALILAIVMFAYWRKDSELVQSYKDRIADNSALIKAIEATNTTYRALEATSENRTRVIDATAEATRGTADAVKAQAEILNEVRRGVERNSAQIEILSRDRSGPRRRDSGS